MQPNSTTPASEMYKLRSIVIKWNILIKTYRRNILQQATDGFVSKSLKETGCNNIFFTPNKDRQKNS